MRLANQPAGQSPHSAQVVIEDLIRESLPNAKIIVEGDDGVHFAAQVVDESFKGMNRVQQQRAVYAALKGKMDGPAGELHALALTTRAPE